MLELLGLVVHFVPRVPHHLNEEELDQAMTTSDERGEFLSGLGQRDAGVGLVFDEPRLGERLDHRRRRAGGDVEGGGQVAHWQGLLWGVQGVRADLSGLWLFPHGGSPGLLWSLISFYKKQY